MRGEGKVRTLGILSAGSEEKVLDSFDFLGLFVCKAKAH